MKKIIMTPYLLSHISSCVDSLAETVSDKRRRASADSLIELIQYHLQMAPAGYVVEELEGGRVIMAGGGKGECETCRGSGTTDPDDEYACPDCSPTLNGGGGAS